MTGPGELPVEEGVRRLSGHTPAREGAQGEVAEAAPEDEVEGQHGIASAHHPVSLA